MNTLVTYTDSAYIARCHKTLKDWGAPLDGWVISSTYDRLEEKAELFTCELCGCNRVRIVHVMKHEYYFERVSVGCICAGIMEGDILAAKERDRLMKNRAKRRERFPRRKWIKLSDGSFILYYRGSRVIINRISPQRERYFISCNSKTAYHDKGKLITNFISAAYAAFDLADPVEEIWNA